MMPRPTGRGMLYGLGGYCWLTQMGGLEGFALQEAFGFAPGAGGKAARTRCKKETSRGPAAPAPPPGQFSRSIMSTPPWRSRDRGIEWDAAKHNHFLKPP